MGKVSEFRLIYRTFAKKHMIVIQSLRSAFLLGSGDLIAQTCIEKRSFKAVDIERTARVASVGACLVGPSLTAWYKILGRSFGASGTANALKKMAADQVVFSPYMQALILAAVNTLGGHNWDFTKEQFRLKYMDIMLTSYQLWPAVQLVNFSFVPANHQVLVVQCVGVFWNTFLCWKTHQNLDNI